MEDSDQTMRPVCGTIGPEAEINPDVLLRDLLADNRKLRFLLACRVAGPLMYTDDGEMQDNSEFPSIDFKRDPVSEIQEKLMARFVNAVNNEGASMGMRTRGEEMQHRLNKYSRQMGSS